VAGLEAHHGQSCVGNQDRQPGPDAAIDADHTQDLSVLRETEKELVVDRTGFVRRRLGSQRGSSLAEFMISLGGTSLVSGIIVSAMLGLSDTENAIGNRTEMHAGARGATELIQHDVTQAGRITLPSAVTLSSGVSVIGVQTVAVTSTAGMFPGEQLVIDTGNN